MGDVSAPNGTPMNRSQDVGGWSSPAMSLKHVAAKRMVSEVESV